MTFFWIRLHIGALKAEVELAWAWQEVVPSRSLQVSSTVPNGAMATVTFCHSETKSNRHSKLFDWDLMLFNNIFFSLTVNIHYSNGYICFILVQNFANVLCNLWWERNFIFFGNVRTRVSGIATGVKEGRVLPWQWKICQKPGKNQEKVEKIVLCALLDDTSSLLGPIVKFLCSDWLGIPQAGPVLWNYPTPPYSRHMNTKRQKSSAWLGVCYLLMINYLYSYK